MSVGAYADFFNRVSGELVDITRLMGQLALFASTAENDTEFTDTVTTIIEELTRQRERLERIGPVDPAVEEVHRSLGIALDRYIGAAQLLLPAEREGRPFEFSEFQALMQEAGSTLHTAGGKLPSG